MEEKLNDENTELNTEEKVDSAVDNDAIKESIISTTDGDIDSDKGSNNIKIALIIGLVAIVAALGFILGIKGPGNTVGDDFSVDTNQYTDPEVINPNYAADDQGNDSSNNENTEVKLEITVNRDEYHEATVTEGSEFILVTDEYGRQVQLKYAFDKDGNTIDNTGAVIDIEPSPYAKFSTDDKCIYFGSGFLNSNNVFCEYEEPEYMKDKTEITDNVAEAIIYDKDNIVITLKSFSRGTADAYGEVKNINNAGSISFHIRDTQGRVLEKAEFNCKVNNADNIETFKSLSKDSKNAVSGKWFITDTNIIDEEITKFVVNFEILFGDGATLTINDIDITEYILG